MTSDSGVLAYRDFDYARLLFDSVSAVFINKRIERNIQCFCDLHEGWHVGSLHKLVVLTANGIPLTQKEF